LIAFSASDNNHEQIFVIDPNGEVPPISLTRVLKTNTHSTEPDWSPSGDHIAFMASVELFTNDVWIMRSDGTEHREIVHEARAEDREHSIISDPVWSPDGSVIAYVDMSKGAVCLAIADGDDGGCIDPDSHVSRHADWTPDGLHIVFQDGQQQISIMDDDGLNVRILASNANDNSNYAPSVSPDGTRIVFDHDLRGPNEVWIMNLDGSDKRFVVEGRCPAWSPDSKQIAFSVDGSDVSVINADGTGLHTIFHSNLLRGIGEFAWSPILSDGTATPSSTWGETKASPTGYGVLRGG